MHFIMRSWVQIISINDANICHKRTKIILLNDRIYMSKMPIFVANWNKNKMKKISINRLPPLAMDYHCTPMQPQQITNNLATKDYHQLAMDYCCTPMQPQQITNNLATKDYHRLADLNNVKDVCCLSCLLAAVKPVQSYTGNHLQQWNSSTRWTVRIIVLLTSYNSGNCANWLVCSLLYVYLF